MVKFEQRSRRIVVEKWVLGPQRIRAGAATTRLFTATQHEPLLNQTITINLPERSANLASQVLVEGAPLILEFGLLFLRPPTTYEEGIQIQEQRFKILAMQAWASLD